MSPRLQSDGGSISGRIEIAAYEDERGNLVLTMRGSEVRLPRGHTVTFDRFVREEEPLRRLEAAAAAADACARVWRRDVNMARADAARWQDLALDRGRRLEALWWSTWLDVWRRIGAAVPPPLVATIPVAQHKEGCEAFTYRRGFINQDGTEDVVEQAALCTCGVTQSAVCVAKWVQNVIYTANPDTGRCFGCDQPMGDSSYHVHEEPVVLGGNRP